MNSSAFLLTLLFVSLFFIGNPSTHAALPAKADEVSEVTNPKNGEVIGEVVVIGSGNTSDKSMQDDIDNSLALLGYRTKQKKKASQTSSPTTEPKTPPLSVHNSVYHPEEPTHEDTSPDLSSSNLTPLREILEPIDEIPVVDTDNDPSPTSTPTSTPTRNNSNSRPTTSSRHDSDFRPTPSSYPPSAKTSSSEDNVSYLPNDVSLTSSTLLPAGTQEIGVTGLLDVTNSFHDNISAGIDLRYAYFIRDGWSLGVKALAYGQDKDTATLEGSIFTEYHFLKEDRVLIPYVGLSAGWADLDTDLHQESGSVLGGNVGLKWFLSPRFALSLSYHVGWSPQNVFPDNEDTIQRAELGVHFYY